MELSYSENKNNFERYCFINVEISEDEMSATLTLISSSGGRTNLSLDDVLKELNKRGVVFGIDTDKINEMLKKGIYNTPVEIARGIEPKEGKDGEIVYHVEIYKELKPKITEDGRVDFHDLGFITNVKEGQLLAEIIPPEKGLPGKTVTGKILPAKDGKNVRLRQGKNVFLSDDGKYFYSAIDGHPVIDGERISVLPVMEIKGDVGPSTGDINFVGSVKVYGNIKSGYKIKAEGDIEVEGYVEAAELISGGKVFLKRGIRGMGKGMVKAAGDIVAKFAENCTLEAGKDVIVNEAIMHSLVSAGNKIEVKGKKGLLVGGSARAGKEIRANVIGSPMATVTIVEVGVNPEYKRRLYEINHELESVESNLAKIKTALDIIAKQVNKGIEVPERTDMIKRLRESEAELLEKKKALEEEKERLALLIETMTLAKISASDTVFPGVNIVIGNANMRLKDKYEHVTFYNHEGQIKSRPYERR
ncbi:hypothetical protein AN618_10080 [Fervidicola ferrireducens]|uniref:Flagellar Assembly Protein A N-terminal region domain-containing protein n=1 Tax=Fervidicola ferrireducens TaxID=520764 RepID=A0A140LAR3_9FIRM|nr:FapA family protein [Fervidicola ferrireducens]KXG77638.1 hypothetical protein AN618_10080 [Fervidicola ferrireducens]